MNTNSFEKGKWYKMNHDGKNWYIKFEKIDSYNLVVYCSEYINKNIFHIKSGNFGKIGTYKFSLLSDLSEIQPYLPANHPDLIQNKIIELW